MMKSSSSLLGIFTLTILGACASSGSDSRILKFSDPVTVTVGGNETNYKAGDSVPMPKEPAKVEAPGDVSLLVVPSVGGSGTSEIKMRKLDSWGGAALDHEVNARLNKVVEKVVNIQRALGNRQGSEALRMVEDLKSQYPGLTYLDFLKASALVLTGDREGARAAVDNALNAFPDNASGRALQNSLKGSR